MIARVRRACVWPLLLFVGAFMHVHFARPDKMTKVLC